MEDDSVWSCWLHWLPICPNPGKRRLSLAAEYSIATTAAWRKGCQKELAYDWRSAHRQGHKQETPVYNCIGSSGELFESRVSWLTSSLTTPSEVASGCSRQHAFPLVLSIGMCQEQISSEALTITCLTDGSTITAAFTTCRVRRRGKSDRNQKQRSGSSQEQCFMEYLYSDILKGGGTTIIFYFLFIFW